MQTTHLHVAFFFLFLFSLQKVCAQGYCSGDTVVFTEPSHPVDYDDVVYKTAPQIDELDIPISVDVRLRVYSPTDLQVGEKRPLVVLVHGGYFIWGDYLDFDAFAQALAKKGFVAATVGYRLCKRVDCLIGASFNVPCQISWSNSFMPSAYAAAVDVNDGIRWLQERAAEYHIDPEKIVVAGHSAGAFTALNVAFLDQSEIQQIVPSAGLWPDYLAEQLDPVDGIRACIPMAGAFVDLDWMESEEVIGENIAVGIVHGTSDGIVDYDDGLAIPCCQTYNTVVHGGCDVAKRVKELGGNYYLLTGEGFGHDIGESPWFDELSVQIPAFIIKTVLCGENIGKHSVVKRTSPLQVCPNNNPNLTVATICDVGNVTTPITTPVKEISGAKVDKTLSLLAYPTFTSGQVHINALTPEANGAWNLLILSMDGQQVRQIQLDLHGSATIELGSLPPGVYSLFFQSMKDGKSGGMQVVKQP